MPRFWSTAAPVLPSRPGLARRVRAASVCAVLWAISCVDVTASPLPHAAYIWQRAWHAGVTSSLAVAVTQLDGFIVLAAEMGASRTHRVAYDPAALAASGRAIGLALRVNAGTVLSEVPPLAARLVAAARSNGLSLAELQLDYDCPESKLDAYRVLVDTVRRRLAPTPVTITALPSWLRQPAFSNLVAATDGYVLQVHALDASLQLCDAEQARSAVARADDFGIPFRVALPTYGHLVATDRDGRVLGVASEASIPSWPSDARVHEVRSDSSLIAGLVRAWSLQPQSHLRGFIWYRLPVDGDRLNWSWATLSAIVSGRVPRPDLALRLRQDRPGLVEVEVANHGDAGADTPVDIRVTWRDAELLACDALAGFAVGPRASPGAEPLIFSGRPRLAPAASRAIGWLRFQGDREVRCEARFD